MIDIPLVRLVKPFKKRKDFKVLKYRNEYSRAVVGVGGGGGQVGGWFAFSPR